MLKKQPMRNLVLGALLCCGVTQAQEVVSAFQIRNQYDRPTGREGNPEITAAKEAAVNAGSMVYLYIDNRSDQPLRLQDLSWNGHDLAYWSGADGGYQAVWHTMRPAQLAPGATGEIAVCLRSALTEDTRFEVTFENAVTVAAVVKAAGAPFRAATIAFAPDFSRAWCYVEELQPDSALPETIRCNGEAIDVKWLSPDWVNQVRVAEITPRQPWTAGERLTMVIEAADRALNCGASLRAFSDLSTFGTYGTGDLRRYAENGVGSFNSFVKAPIEQLDQAAALNLKVVSGSPVTDPATAGHQALYAYLLLDEPDCHDYSHTERPMGQRLGANAAEMLRRYDGVVAGDPKRPALLTINLTFTPFNYFTYAPLADIANPDIYTNTCGWSVKYIDHHLSMVKRAAGPRPFAYTYQSSWEEWSTAVDRWVSKEQLLREGFDAYRDTSKKPRGFGFNTNPDEMAIAMHYGLGNGATALFAYTDATETGSGLLFHGSDILPENWEAVGHGSRVFRNLQPLLGPAHPMQWATANQDQMWVRTLLTGGDAALVVAVNESYRSEPEGFSIAPLRATFSFPNLPWLAPSQVFRVGEDGFTAVNARHDGSGLTWDDEVRNGAIYLVTPSPEVFERIDAAAAALRTQLPEGLRREAAAKAALQDRENVLREQGEAVVGSAINGYLLASDELTPVTTEALNAFDGWEEKGTKPLGAEWSFTVAPAEVGSPLTIWWEGRGYGAPGVVQVTAPDGTTVSETKSDITGMRSRLIEFTPALAGTYTMTATVQPDTAVEHGIRFGRYLFLATAERSQRAPRLAAARATLPLDGRPLNGYYAKVAEFPAAPDGSYNAIECWEASGVTEFGAVWELEVTAADKRHVLLWNAWPGATPAAFSVTAPDGATVYSAVIPANSTAEQFTEVPLPLPGRYQVRISQQPAAAVEHALRLPRYLFHLQE